MKLEKVINTFIGFGCESREQALFEISRSIDLTSMWEFCKFHNVLDENRNAEDFAIPFMLEYNKTFGQKY